MVFLSRRKAEAAAEAPSCDLSPAPESPPSSSAAAVSPAYFATLAAASPLLRQHFLGGCLLSLALFTYANFPTPAAPFSYTLLLFFKSQQIPL